MEEFDIFYYEQNYKDGGCRYELDGQTIMMSESDDRYTVQVESAYPDMVCTIKHYFADTLTLMTEGHYLKKGNCRIGVWTTYDRSGEVVEEIDYEQGWNVSWETLLPIISKQIELKTIVSINRFILNEEKSELDTNLETDGKPKSEPEENTENETEEENEWFDEYDLFEEELEEEHDIDLTVGQARKQEKPEPVKCWVIGSLLAPRKIVEHYYSGDTGEKLYDKIIIMK